MTFGKALNKLMRGKAKYIGSRKAAAQRQNLGSIKYWLCQSASGQLREANFENFIKATDWKVQDE